jgi:hypothetical protein
MEQQSRAASTDMNAASTASSETPPLEEGKTGAPVPYVGRPLDGSQYHDVIEEQIYADQRPGVEEQKPRRNRDQQGAKHRQ